MEPSRQPTIKQLIWKIKIRPNYQRWRMVFPEKLINWKNMCIFQQYKKQYKDVKYKYLN